MYTRYSFACTLNCCCVCCKLWFHVSIGCNAIDSVHFLSVHPKNDCQHNWGDRSMQMHSHSVICERLCGALLKLSGGPARHGGDAERDNREWKRESEPAYIGEDEGNVCLLRSICFRVFENCFSSDVFMNILFSIHRLMMKRSTRSLESTVYNDERRLCLQVITARLWNCFELWNFARYIITSASKKSEWRNCRG